MPTGYKYHFTCKKCEGGFDSNIKGGPKACPRCKSYHWRESRKRGMPVIDIFKGAKEFLR